MNTKVAVGFVLAVCFMVAGVAAVWLSGLNITGTITGPGGSAPSLITYSRPINMTSGENTTIEIPYTNPDGNQTFRFFLDETNITSSNPACNLEDQDYTWTIMGNATAMQPLTESGIDVLMIPGINNITITVSPDPAACPIEGTYEINAEPV